MRFVYLIITVVLVWLLLDTYLDHAAKPKTTVQGPMERSGIIADDSETSGSEPFFGREIEKARSVEKQLQDDVERKLKEIEKRTKQ